MKRIFAPLLAALVGLSGPVARIAVPVAAVAVVAAPEKAHAYEKIIGVVTSTGASANNSTTAVPFTLPALSIVAIQCDAAACVNAGSGSSTAASCSTGNANQGVRLDANQLYDVPLSHTGTYAADTIAVISVSGTANCAVYQVVTPP